MIDETLTALELARKHLHHLVSDLDAGQMVAQPGGVANHPAWTLGHLTCSLHLLGGEVGLAPDIPDGYGDLFLTGTRPVANVSTYPAKSVLVRALEDAARRLGEHLRTLTPEAMGDALPDDRYRRLLPTKGNALVHILVGHFSFHVGQVATWRRAMDLPVRSEMDRLQS